MSRLKVVFQGLLPKTGEVVVVQPEKIIPQNEAKELYNICHKAFPENKVVILLPKANIISYDKEEFLKFLDSLRELVETGE